MSMNPGQHGCVLEIGSCGSRGLRPHLLHGVAIVVQCAGRSIGGDQAHPADLHRGVGRGLGWGDAGPAVRPGPPQTPPRTSPRSPGTLERRAGTVIVIAGIATTIAVLALSVV